MKVLSLFDGISCGRVALERAGIPIEKYDAFEIDKYAIKISEKNYPNIIHHGDVFEGDFNQFKGYDLLLGGSPCGVAGTKIKIKEGYKNIENIQLGDLVLTHNNRYRKVIRLYKRDSDHYYTLKFNGNHVLKLTGNHPIYVYRNNKFEFIKVENLTEDDFVCININKNNTSIPYNDNLLWLFGRFIADGYFPKDKDKICFCIRKDKKEDFEEHLDNIPYYITHADRPVSEYYLKSDELMNLYLSLKNKKAVDKYIPEFILDLPKEQLKNVYDGYISGGGHIRRDKRTITTWNSSSEDLILSIGLMIAKLFNNYPTTTVRESEYKEMPNGKVYHSKVNYSSQIGKKINPKNKKIIDDKILIKIKEIKKTEVITTVYNMEVEEDNTYTMNNIIVHNCTYWSIARNNREVTPDGLGGKLFMQYVRALKESGCKYFLYENNYSIHKNIKAFISEQLGVEPIMINSALVSGQSRKRCYWTNIPNVIQPEDKGIMLKDILEDIDSIPINSIDGKSHTIPASYYKIAENPFSSYGSERGRQRIAVPIKGCSLRGRYIESNSRSKKCEGGTYQALEIRDDDKANCLTTVQKDSMVCKPIRVGEIGKGGQGQRIYSVRGKSVTLSANGGGQGAKTGLYKIDLPDGDYIVRKLTPIEAERLQTLPDNYTEGISNTQRYKCVGNGWTVDVIAHILKNLA